MSPLSTLLVNNHLWQWTDIENKSFEDIKIIFYKETILSFIKFDVPFDLHMDTSDDQIMGVLLKEQKPVNFFYGQ